MCSLLEVLFPLEGSRHHVMIPPRVRLPLGGWLAEKAQLENGVGSSRFDKVIERGVCRQSKVLSQGRSTHAFRGQKRSQDLLDYRPASLWRQFHRTKRLAAPPQAQDAFARRAEMVDPSAHAVGSNQKSTTIVFMQIHRGRTSLSRLATGHREQHHRTEDRQTHTQAQQHRDAPTEDGHGNKPSDTSHTWSPFLYTC